MVNELQTFRLIIVDFEIATIGIHKILSSRGVLGKLLG